MLRLGLGCILALGGLVGCAHLRGQAFERHVAEAQRLCAIGRHDAALEQLDAAFRLRPYRVDVELERVHVLMAAKRWPQADAAAKSLLQRYPRDPRVHYAAGRAALALGYPNEALTRFAAAVALDPTHLDARLALAHIHLEAGRWAEAREHYERARPLATDVQTERKIAAALDRCVRELPPASPVPPADPPAHARAPRPEPFPRAPKRPAPPPAAEEPRGRWLLDLAETRRTYTLDHGHPPDDWINLLDIYTLRGRVGYERRGLSIHASALKPAASRHLNTRRIYVPGPAVFGSPTLVRAVVASRASLATEELLLSWAIGEGGGRVELGEHHERLRARLDVVTPGAGAPAARRRLDFETHGYLGVRGRWVAFERGLVGAHLGFTHMRERMRGEGDVFANAKTDTPGKYKFGPAFRRRQHSRLEMLFGLTVGYQLPPVKDTTSAITMTGSGLAADKVEGTHLEWAWELRF